MDSVHGKRLSSPSGSKKNRIGEISLISIQIDWKLPIVSGVDGFGSVIFRLGEEMRERRGDVQLLDSCGDGIDDRTAHDGVDEEFHNEIDADDGEDEDEGIGKSSEVVDNRSVVEEKTERSHEEDGVE